MNNEPPLVSDYERPPSPQGEFNSALMFMAGASVGTIVSIVAWYCVYQLQRESNAMGIVFITLPLVKIVVGGSMSSSRRMKHFGIGLMASILLGCLIQIGGQCGMFPNPVR